MAVKMNEVHPISQIDIDKLTKGIGKKLPTSYEKFLLLNNGAKPTTNSFKVNESNDCGVDQFIPVTQIQDEMNNIDHISSTKIPIAWAEGGNYLLLDLDDERISFWDHEVPEEQFDIAPEINTFIAESMLAFDTSMVELKEGQVKSSWIDPDFLKSL